MKRTFDLGLVFKHSEGLKLVGFCDSDWGGDPNDKRSTSGYCFKISDDSSVIGWSSREQQTVALSSTEAEYTSISLTSQERVFFFTTEHQILHFFPIIPAVFDVKMLLAQARAVQSAFVSVEWKRFVLVCTF